MADRDFRFLIVEVNEEADIDACAKEIFEDSGYAIKVMPVYWDGFGHYVTDVTLHPGYESEEEEVEANVDG